MASDYDVWKCTCGQTNDWGAPCKKGHGHFDEKTGDVRLWECSYCKTINAWNRYYCTHCKGRYEAPRS